MLGITKKKQAHVHETWAQERSRLEEPTKGDASEQEKEQRNKYCLQNYF